MPLDQRQQFLGLEARLQDHQTARLGGVKGVEVGRRMIDRPGDDGAHVGVRSDVENQAHHLSHAAHHGLSGRLALHALGQAGGTRGVDHIGANRLGRRVPGFLFRQPGVPIGSTGGHITGSRVEAVGIADLRRRGDHEQLHTGGDGVADGGQQVGVNHHRPGAAVADDVAGLVGLEVPVDGHRVGTHQGGRHGCLEKGEVVAQHHGHSTIGADAQRRQAAGRLGHPLRELGMRELPFTTDDPADHGQLSRRWFSPSWPSRRN